MPIDIERTNSPELFLAGDNDRLEIRSNVIFTTSYVSTNIINISYARNILLHIILGGTGITDSQLKIQFGTALSLFDLVHAQIDIGSGTLPFGNPTLTPTVFEMGGTSVSYSLPLINPGCSHMRCLVKANAAAGLLQLTVMRGQGNCVGPMLVFGT